MEVSAEFAPGAAAFLEAFYSPLRVYVVSPVGLAGPYRLLHGGGQGDSGGVAGYSLVGIVRSWYHRGKMGRNLDPGHLRSRTEGSEGDLFRTPFDDAQILFEFGYIQASVGPCPTPVPVPNYLLAIGVAPTFSLACSWLLLTPPFQDIVSE